MSVTRRTHQSACIYQVSISMCIVGIKVNLDIPKLKQNQHRLVGHEK
jgi:hypothetical protein